MSNIRAWLPLFILFTTALSVQAAAGQVPAEETVYLSADTAQKSLDADALLTLIIGSDSARVRTIITDALRNKTLSQAVIDEFLRKKITSLPRGRQFDEKLDALALLIRAWQPRDAASVSRLARNALLQPCACSDATYEAIVDALIAHKWAINAPFEPQRPVTRPIFQLIDMMTFENEENRELLRRQARIFMKKGADIQGPCEVSGVSSILLHAIERGNTAGARLALEFGVDPNLCSHAHFVLINAVEENDLDFIKTVVAAGGDVNAARGCDGLNALLFALELNRVSLVDYLLEHGADVNQPRWSDGLTPLHLACRHGTLDTVKKLIACGANVHARGKSGHTIFSSAAAFGTEETMRYLLDHGASVNECAEDGETPLTCVLACAEQPGRDARAAFLLEHGAEVNPTGTNAALPLHLACLNGDSAIAARLIEAGADVFASDRYKRNALYCAVQGKDLACAAMLLERGVSTECVYAHDLYPPEVALGEDLAEDADNYFAESLDGSLYWPLNRAIADSSLEMVKLLVSHHADVNEKVGDMTPILAVARTQNDAILRYLIEQGATLTGAESNTPFIFELREPTVAMLALCQENGCDLSACMPDGRTLLHTLCQRNSTTPEIMQYLIDQGVRADAMDQCGLTPLFYLCSKLAASQNHVDTALLHTLVKAGANINFVNESGVSPLALAILNGNVELVKALLADGADKNCAPISTPKFTLTPERMIEQIVNPETRETIRELLR